MNWHFYGVIRTADIPAVWNADLPLETIQNSEFCALVSKPLVGSVLEQALQHNKILEQTNVQCFVLPARYAAPLETEQITKQLSQTDWQERFAALQNCQEFAVRAEFKTLETKINTSSGRAYLESLQIGQKAQEENQVIAQKLLVALCQHAPHRESKILENTSQKYRLAFLVAQPDLFLFGQECQRLLNQFQDQFLRLSWHGAFVPYSFSQPKEQS